MFLVFVPASFLRFSSNTLLPSGYTPNRQKYPYYEIKFSKPNHLPQIYFHILVLPFSSFLPPHWNWIELNFHTHKQSLNSQIDIAEGEKFDALFELWFLISITAVNYQHNLHFKTSFKTHNWLIKEKKQWKTFILSNEKIHNRYYVKGKIRGFTSRLSSRSLSLSIRESNSHNSFAFTLQYSFNA